MDEVEKAIRKIRNGVFVITFNLDGMNYGITTAWVNRAAFKPNMLMISVGKNRNGYEELLEAEVFCVNILGNEHLEIARHFGFTAGNNLNNFKDVELKEMENGSPVLENCVAAIECKLIKKVDAGDHVILFGEILNGVDLKGDAMVFNREDFS
ncbi:flavin reductase [Candidatus Woesearchaeota archaeon]|nr:flavin reductase [Candidatus Woesearchaeota archaeon]